MSITDDGGRRATHVRWVRSDMYEVFCGDEMIGVVRAPEHTIFTASDGFGLPVLWPATTDAKHRRYNHISVGAPKRP